MTRPSADAEAVLADRLQDLGQEPAPQGSLSALRQAGRLQHEGDPETAAVAREVIETADTMDLIRAIVLTSQR